MNGEVTDLIGIYAPTFGLIMIVAFLLLLPLRWVLGRTGVYAWFWHRGLVDLSLMVIACALLVALVTHQTLL
jgi:hypothetical protein